MIDDDVQRRVLVSSQVPGNNYCQISIADPPAPLGKKTIEPSKEIEPIDSSFYFLRVSSPLLSLPSPFYILLTSIYPAIEVYNSELHDNAGG